MRFVAVLNREGGTLRSTDLGAFIERMRETLAKSGHQLETEIVGGADIETALAKASAGKAEIVIAGGGDGTVSAAAAALMNKKKALAVLPAGTMNLFARGLGIPCRSMRPWRHSPTAGCGPSTWPAPTAGRSSINSRSACTSRWSICATTWNSSPGGEKWRPP